MGVYDSVKTALANNAAPDDAPPPAPVDNELLDAFGPNGERKSVPARDWKYYEQQGWRPATAPENLEAQKKAKYGDHALRTALESAANTATLGGSNWLAGTLGGDEEREQLREDAARNTVANIGGGVLGAVLSGGYTGISKLGAAAGANVAGRVAETQLPGIVKGVVTLGARGATEGAVYGLGQGVGELALDDDPLTAEKVAHTLGVNTLMGGAAGGVLGGMGSLLGDAAVAARQSAGNLAARLSSKGADASTEAFPELANMKPADLQKAEVVERERVKVVNQANSIDLAKQRAAEVKNIHAKVQADAEGVFRDYESYARGASDEAFQPTDDPHLKARLGKSADQVQRLADKPKKWVRNPQPALDALEFQEHAYDAVIDHLQERVDVMGRTAEAADLQARIDDFKKTASPPLDANDLNARVRADRIRSFEEAKTKVDESPLGERGETQIDPQVPSEMTPERAIRAENQTGVGRRAKGTPVDLGDTASDASADTLADDFGKRDTQRMPGREPATGPDLPPGASGGDAARMNELRGRLADAKDLRAQNQDLQARINDFVQRRAAPSSDQLYNINAQIDALARNGIDSPKLQAIKAMREQLSGTSGLLRGVVKKAVGAKVGAMVGGAVGGPVGAAAGGLAGMVAGDAAAGRLVGAITYGAAKTAAGMERGLAFITKGVTRGTMKAAGAGGDALARPFLAQKAGRPARAYATQSNAQRRIAEINNLAAGGDRTRERIADGLHGLWPLPDIGPGLVTRLTDTTMRAIEFLQSKTPMRPPIPGVIQMGPSQPKPSEIETATFRRSVAGVQGGPPLIIDEINRGRLTPEHVEAVKAVYPEWWEKTKADIIDRLSELQETLPFAKRLNLSIAFEIPVDPAMAMVPQLQAHFQNEDGTEGGQRAPDPKALGKKSNPEPTQVQRITDR